MLKSDYVIVCVDAHELARNFSMEGSKQWRAEV